MTSTITALASRSPECTLGYPEACANPTCTDVAHLPAPDPQAEERLLQAMEAWYEAGRDD